MKKNKEVHLFIIWEKARNFEEEIMSQLENKFRVIQTYLITWSPYQVGNNFTRFYGANLPKDSEKEKHCGIGEFRLIVVIDEDPLYDDRNTSKGVRRVNVNMFDTKSSLRAITGGGHKIHGTDSEKETRHDLILLTGLSLSDFLVKYPERKEDVIHKDDLLGCHGWDSFEQLFYVLNECSENIVLRNVENIDLEYLTKNKSDIDLLARNSEEIKYVLGDLTSLNKEKSHMHVSVNKTEVLFEVYQSGTNLYHESFEETLFASKVKTNNIYHPSEEIEMYGLIYHALLYKENLEIKHEKKIFTKYERYLKDKDKSEIGLLTKLIDYFDTNSYKFIKPNIGYFNLRSEIKDRVLINVERDSSLKRKVKKLLDINIEKRTVEIYMLKIISNKIIMKLKLWKGFCVCFYLGLD